MKKLGLLLLGLVGFIASPAQAQTKNALVVTSCGTLPVGITFTVGQYGFLTVDNTGVACTSSGGGGGGTSIIIPSSSSANALSHASTTALGTSLVAKASAGNLYGYNCSAITGGSAGYCIAYNGTAAPSTGALTGSLVLDFCYHDTTARGCSLSRIHMGVQYSAGIVILETSAATPYTYTTGTNTAAISADYK